MIEERPIRIARVRLQLLPKTVISDLNIVEAVRKYATEWFTHVIFCVGAHDEFPPAFDHPVVIRGIHNCKQLGLIPVWGRYGWPPWSGTIEKDSHLDPEHYKRTIGDIKLEAQFLGVDETYIDWELYNANDLEENPLGWLKVHRLTDREQISMRSAILSAIASSGRVTYIKPSSSRDSASYSWMFTDTGEIPLCTSTYKALNVNEVAPIHPPPDRSFTMRAWGSDVRSDAQDNPNYLTPEQAMSIDMDEVIGKYPDCDIWWAHFYYGDTIEALKGFSGDQPTI